MRAVANAQRKGGARTAAASLSGGNVGRWCCCRARVADKGRSAVLDDEQNTRELAVSVLRAAFLEAVGSRI
jgi:hypothetical protein